jgi:predicted outer membrane protein
MRLTIVFALALTAAAQDHRYSSKPSAPGGKSKGGTRIKNAIEYTPDGVFLQKAAVDNAFVIEFSSWAKIHGEIGNVRTTASELAFLEMKLGDDLRKLAGRKHVTLPEKVNDRDAAERARIDSMHPADTDRSFVEQVLRRYDQEIVSFDREAQAASDPDIKSFAADGVTTLQKHRRMVEALQDKLR